MKYLLILGLLLTNTAFATPQKRILMVINEGFQVDEYYEPRRLFEAQGYEIKTASRFGGLVHPGRKYPMQLSIQSDLSFEQIHLRDFDAITFAGGAGAWTDYFPNRVLHQVLAQALQNPKMIVGLICAGTGLLATANNLDGRTPIARGRHVTGYLEVEGLLRTQGQVHYDGGDPKKPYVVRDRNLVTGRDPSSSALFGAVIISMLK